jgi:hypothetical protein
MRKRSNCNDQRLTHSPSRPRVLELVLQGKRDGHRDFCLSARVHENDIAYNRLGFLARRIRDVVEQLRDFSNAQHGLPHNPSG